MAWPTSRMEVERGCISCEKKHPDEEREEPAKDEARKKIIEEYANSLRELILHQKGAEPESCARSVPALRLY